MQFEFATAARIVFGAGTARQTGPAARQMGGERVLLVTSRARVAAFAVEESLRSAKLAVVALERVGEPTVEWVRQAAGRAREERCDVVVGCGGGSAIDAAKAVAALLTNSGDLLDYLEVVGKGEPLPNPGAPFIAVPTTAGTGTEVTRNAVLASTEHRVKASLRSAGMLARLAVVDPDLTLDLPRAVTAATGLDALTQLIEPYVSARANPMTDGFCTEGLRRAARALPRVWEDGHDVEARSDMALASLMGGLALANAGLGAAHGFAAPIGGMFPAPHGAVCAALLPHVMAVNLRALPAASEGRRRYGEIARIVTGRTDARPEDGAAWVAELCGRLEIPRLGAYGVNEADIPALVEAGSRASSMKGNPVKLSGEQLVEILERAL